MNKKIILSTLALAAVLTACDDEYMDQFDINTQVTDVKSETIVLGKSDYSAIASNSTNQSLALALDPENNTYVEALKKVGSQACFSEMISAEEFIPAWLDKQFFNADDGSVFKVTYNKEREASGNLDAFTSISAYQLEEEDYVGVWGDKVKASFLTPQTKSKVASILGEKSNGAVNGAMTVVNYAYSEVEPSIGGGGEVEPESPYAPISDAANGAANEVFYVKGTVTATYAKGVVISDGTGSILVYHNATSNYSLGDVIEVKGAVTKYSGFMQFGKDAEIKSLERRTAVKYPEPETMDGAALTAWCSNPSFKYVKVTGKYEISGNYHNLTIEGTGSRAGSISYPVDGVIDPSLNGKNVDVVGYLSGFSSKYIYFMATSVVEAGTKNEYTPVGIVANAEAGDYKVRGVVTETYARGFLITDGTGNILVYKSGTGAKVGDQVTVSGKTSAYAGLMQYPNTAEVVIVKEGGKFTTPAPQVLTGADFDAYVAAPYCAYVQYTGTLSISGSYYNVAIDGTAVQGSLSYPNADAVDPSLNGQKVVVTGYSIGQTSSGKYLNTMITSVAAAPASAKAAFAKASGADIKPNVSELYTFADGKWSLYSSKDVQIVVLNDAENAELAQTSLANVKAVLPMMLAKKLPYFINETTAVVVYKDGNNYKAAELEVKDGVWAEPGKYTTETVTFSKENGVISANISSFYDNALLGDEGGFKAYDVVMGEGLKYVWANTAGYGWKASAYVNKTNIPSESWLVSSAISLKKAKKPVLTFDEVYQYTNGAAPTDFLKVRISSDFNGDVKTSSWTEIAIPTWSTGADWNFVNTGYIDLSAFCGSSIVIAFVYTSNDTTGPTWEVKNLKVIEMPEE